MDIDLLSKMVKELILDNDRVVLPGLGSFVAEIVPSTFLTGDIPSIRHTEDCFSGLSRMKEKSW